MLYNQGRSYIATKPLRPNKNHKLQKEDASTGGIRVEPWSKGCKNCLWDKTQRGSGEVLEANAYAITTMAAAFSRNSAGATLSRVSAAVW
jgi:hypothetical protein